MSVPMTAVDVLDREFLEMRAKLLELAAFFDRVDRAAGAVDEDPRTERIRQALNILLGDQPERAAQIQLLFSREFKENWQDVFQLTPRS